MAVVTTSSRCCYTGTVHTTAVNTPYSLVAIESLLICPLDIPLDSLLHSLLQKPTFETATLRVKGSFAFKRLANGTL
jgi:hypothetical protein